MLIYMLRCMCYDVWFRIYTLKNISYDFYFKGFSESLTHKNKKHHIIIYYIAIYVLEYIHWFYRGCGKVAIGYIYWSVIISI